MATSSKAVDVSSFTTDAKFRTWGSAVSAAIAASGLTQTSDTGQINWSTVTRPTAADTKAGYEIWRFNDSLQSTKPIYFRLDYGSNGNVSGQAPGTWLTVGTGTDGAGTITGVGVTVEQGSNTSNAATNTSMFVSASYSTSAGACFIGAAIATSSNSNSGLWVINRTCSATTGIANGNGIWILNNRGSGTRTGGASYNPPINYAMATTTGISFIANSRVSSLDLISINRAQALLPNVYPINGFLSYYENDIKALTVFNMSAWGSSHTYLALGTNLATHVSAITGSTNLVAAVIWE